MPLVGFSCLFCEWVLNFASKNWHPRYWNVWKRPHGMSHGDFVLESNLIVVWVWHHLGRKLLPHRKWQRSQTNEVQSLIAKQSNEWSPIYVCREQKNHPEREFGQGGRLNVVIGTMQYIIIAMKDGDQSFDCFVMCFFRIERSSFKTIKNLEILAFGVFSPQVENFI